MKNNKFLKIILYISTAVLFLTGSFLLLGKKASANNLTIKTYDGKTIIYTVDGVNSDSDSDEKEPRLCSICQKNECMEGQLYCEDCYNNILNSESTIDLMLKMQKFQEEANDVQKQHAEEQAEEQAREKANDRKLSATDSFFLVMVIIVVGIFCVVVFHVYINGNSSGPKIFFKAYKGSESDNESENSHPNQSTETESVEQEELKDISLVEPAKEALTAGSIIEPAKEVVIAEKKIEPVEEKVLVKKNFEDCLKQQTTSFRSGDSFAVCLGDNDELILMHYYSNSFNTVKVKVEDNGKLKVIHDFRRDHDFMVAFDYELGKDSLRFDLKSAKGHEVSFVLKPIVKAKINGYEINYDQTKDYSLISITCLPNYINWIQQNAVLEEQKKKELTNQELREKIKNLDPDVRNKFMELAKNGKTIEAIKVCNEVTGLGLKDAKKVIEYKLYY